MKCLSCRCEDQWTMRSHAKKPDGVQEFLIPVLGDRDRKASEIHWPAILADISIVQAKVDNSWRSSRCTHMYTYTFQHVQHTYTCTQTQKTSLNWRKHRPGIAYWALSGSNTAVSLPRPSPFWMMTSWKLPHGVSWQLAFYFPYALSSPKILSGGKKEREGMIARFPGEGLVALSHVLLQEHVNQLVP